MLNSLEGINVFIYSISCFPFQSICSGHSISYCTGTDLVPQDSMRWWLTLEKYFLYLWFLLHWNNETSIKVKHWRKSNLLTLPVWWWPGETPFSPNLTWFSDHHRQRININSCFAECSYNFIVTFILVHR